MLVLTGVLLLMGTLSSPIQVRADGDPRPQCPPGHDCKP